MAVSAQTIDHLAPPLGQPEDEAAAAHDRWFREQVQLALDEADKPDAVFIPHEVVMAEAKAQLDRIAARARQQG